MGPLQLSLPSLAQTSSYATDNKSFLTWLFCSTPKPGKDKKCSLIRIAAYCTDMGGLQHKCNQLRLLATCSITITNKQNHNVIDYDYIENKHDYNRDYICHQTSSERKQTLLV